MRNHKRWLRALGGVLVLAVVVWRVGTGPFLAGVKAVHAPAALAALAAGLLSTLAYAWRWRRVATRLGVPLSPREAISSYYRSLFLNATLPFGVAGDVHRALRHGGQIGDRGLAARAVVLERSAGFVAQVLLAGVVLMLLPSPLRHGTPRTVAVVALAVVAVLIGLALIPGPRPTAARWVRSIRAGLAEIRNGALARGTWGVVLVASGLALSGWTVVFLIAARAAGVPAPFSLLTPLALLALVSAALPLNLAGWGPREGVAGWAFAAAGLGANMGVTTSVAYGVLSLIACLPGAVILVAGWLRPAPARVPVAPSGGSRE
jgi:uncharacterized membrane protein YbhN (UPF0104 family)